MVNEIRLSFSGRNRKKWVSRSGGRWPKLASQGFVTGLLGRPWIVTLAPSIEGIENSLQFHSLSARRSPT